MAITKYVLSEARAAYPLSSVDSYIEQRREIYEKLKNKNILDDFFNNKVFNNLAQKHKELKNLPNQLKNIKITNPTTNALFTGENDAAIINQLINKAKALQGIEDFNKYVELLNELESTNIFIKENIRGKISTNNVFAISTRDYILMKEAILKAKSNNDIKAAQEAAKKYYSGLIGNLGETIGIIQGYNLINEQMKTELSHMGIEIQVTNTGDKTIANKRAIGDTTVSFTTKDNQIVGSISISNKLTAKYDVSKSIPIKLRTTFPTQIPNQGAKELYYNLFSLHGNGKNKTYDLYPNKNKEILAFRRYIAALIMKENLFGAFKGDNVYFFNYGEYVYTMNNLLTYWISNDTQTSGIPVASLPGHKKRLSIMNGANTEEDADNIISKQNLIITYNLHIGNLNKALGI